MRNPCLFFLLFSSVFFTEKAATAESWGAVLFNTKQHSFGSVALGAQAEFRFELMNMYNSDLQLVSVRSSCSCTAAQFSTSLLKPGETGAVIARFNTSGQHLREKSATLTVQLEMKINGILKVDTVQLSVSGYIRPDVLLTPGSVEFGSVAEKTTTVRILQLEYTGRPGWALTNIERSLPFVYARAEEIRRERGNVMYRITVILKEDAPPGYVRDVLRLTTNEFQQGRSEPVEITLPIQGVVTGTIQAKPSPLQIGILSPGETVVKNMIVRNETPFQITNVSASDTRFRFSFSNQASTIHLISVSFSAGQPQDIAEVFRISTNDSRHNIITVDAFGRVMNQPP